MYANQPETESPVFVGQVEIAVAAGDLLLYVPLDTGLDISCDGGSGAGRLYFCLIALGKGLSTLIL
ncbi:MAG: hypothetical protein DRP71_14580 [Verrucomicrobia bacterium]|nr:MAG: hypothetical protein DRP71_14580 [Verrucomicrobiota bacterium]